MSGNQCTDYSPSSPSRSKPLIDAMKTRRQAQRSRGALSRLARSWASSYRLWVGLALLVVVAALVTMYLYPETPTAQVPINDEDLISQVNTQSRTFTAAPSPFLHGWTVGDVRKIFGRTFWTHDAQFVPMCAPFTPLQSLPQEYDSRATWPACYQNIQVATLGRCSSSWALATASALSDRFCIADPDLAGTRLSAQELVSCESSSHGCNGGSIDRPHSYLLTRGLVSEECFPYTATSSSCSMKCSKNLPMKIKSYCRVSGERAIMGEIYAHGPVVGLVMLLDDFMVYSSGVYASLKTAKRLLDSEKNLVMHAVKLIGWGSERGHPYWLVENSFGSEWGDRGFAKISRREGNLFADGVLMADTPDLASLIEETPAAAGVSGGGVPDLDDESRLMLQDLLKSPEAQTIPDASKVQENDGDASVMGDSREAGAVGVGEEVKENIPQQDTVVDQGSAVGAEEDEGTTITTGGEDPVERASAGGEDRQEL
eukprot:GHVS01064547.1.p1 GENE.GHVS01064547.1~~GHVS01064547.1.p1  ORF type:complete len:485 (+),score=75.34 GHVS01064547.1:32-1486(+)